MNCSNRSRHSRESGNPVFGLPLGKTGFPIETFGNDGFFLIRVLLLIVSGIFIGGCATVQPWERDLLAEPAMQVDPNPVQSGYDDHIYFSIEGSSGGRTFGGGGCGCN